MNTQIDIVAVANLVFTCITTFCALYLSLAALKHSARPRIDVRLVNNPVLPCGTEHLFIFEFINKGHWYAKPTAINVMVFCNYDPRFDLLEIRYGSTQSYSETEVKEGVGRLKYLKARGLKLTHGEEGEQVHVRAKTPSEKGRYLIRISAFSDNGVSLKKEFRVKCVNMKHEDKHTWSWMWSWRMHPKGGRKGVKNHS